MQSEPEQPGPAVQVVGHLKTVRCCLGLARCPAAGKRSLAGRLCVMQQACCAYSTHGDRERLQVTILIGGCLLFGDEMPLRKLAGVVLAMCGIAWYSYLQLRGRRVPS